MPELRKDPVVGRWVVFSPERQIRPERYKCEELLPTRPEEDPFLEGHEKYTPAELYAVRPNGGGGEWAGVAVTGGVESVSRVAGGGGVGEGGGGFLRSDERDRGARGHRGDASPATGFGEAEPGGGDEGVGGVSGTDSGSGEGCEAAVRDGI